MLLTADYPPGLWSGIGVAVETQAHSLAATGVDVHVVLPRQVARSARECGLRIHSLDGSHFPVDPRGFDWLHLHSLSLAELALEIRQRFGVKLAYTAHSLIARELAQYPESNFWSRVQLAVMRASDAVIFLSESERAAALAIAPDLAARSRVVPNGLTPQIAVPRRNTPDGPIVFAGRFARSKGIALLARFMTELVRKMGCRFVLAGGHGDAESERIVRETQARLGSACRLAGWLPPAQLRALFGRAALVVAPSEYEPFGMVALEAMSMGAPVLAARTGGLAEIVRPESGGRLAETRDPREWVERAAAMLSDVAGWRALHERGPRYVAKFFDPNLIAQRLLGEVYAG
jgi:1,4-alpha-glucan branching enzyme